MMEKVVVMGGSFNPPTLAHLRLMVSAMDAVSASRGIFVPTAHAYVLKKMKRMNCPQDTLSEAIRLLREGQPDLREPDPDDEGGARI